MEAWSARTTNDGIDFLAFVIAFFAVFVSVRIPRDWDRVLGAITLNL
jgi:hypothetical protein